jgi:hypothetical protein
MAVIVRRALVSVAMLAGLCGVRVELRAGVRVDDAADVHKVIGGVAEALSSGEVTQAMQVFSKSYKDYDKLSSYFEGLAGAYFVENKLDFTDEDVSATAATVMLHWDLALTTKQGGFTTNRSGDVTLKLVREGKGWRIVEFGPIGLFDPGQ